MLPVPGKKTCHDPMAVLCKRCKCRFGFLHGGSCCSSARVYGIGNAQVSLHPPGILAIDAPCPPPVKKPTSKTEGSPIDEQTSSMAGVTAPTAEAGPVRRMGSAESLLVPCRAGDVPVAGRLERRIGREPCPDRSGDAGSLALGADCDRTVSGSISSQQDRRSRGGRSQDRN